MGNAVASQSAQGATVAPTSTAESQFLDKDIKEEDVFRDTPFRYLGYTNEIGEALRQHISRKMYVASYAIATTYVCADTINKGMTSMNKGRGVTKSLISSGDAFIWQFLASVVLPGYIINRITYVTAILVQLQKNRRLISTPVGKYMPVAVGLLSIPLIIKPIDSGVTWAMDNTIRQMYVAEIEK